MTTTTLPTVAKELAGLDHVPVSSLEPFQGELKELSEREYNKLKKSILETGTDRAFVGANGQAARRPPAPTRIYQRRVGDGRACCLHKCSQ